MLKSVGVKRYKCLQLNSEMHQEKKKWMIDRLKGAIALSTDIWQQNSESRI